MGFEKKNIYKNKIFYEKNETIREKCEMICKDKKKNVKKAQWFIKCFKKIQKLKKKHYILGQYLINISKFFLMPTIVLLPKNIFLKAKS